MHLILVPHPTSVPAEPFEVWTNVELVAGFGAAATLNMWFGVTAPAERFAIPEAAEPARKDELWRTTCFEAFLRGSGEQAYREWNFAPSGDWASYDFTGYREGMQPADTAAPYLRLEDNLTWWTLGATIAVPSGEQWQAGLSAVLEERDGTKTYWALAHPDPDKPDFHHPDCFVARLA